MALPEAATKGANNPHFKSKYADLGAVIEAVKPALIKHGLFFTQHCHPSEDGVIVETVLGHAGGEERSLGKLYVPANKRDAQGFGSALTYARRYALMTAFGVPCEDDDGNAASRTVANDPAPTRQAARQADRDAPFPQGPAKNKTELKAMGRELWRDVEAAGDPDQLEILLRDGNNPALMRQLQAALPQWWSGGTRDGEEFEGLGEVIARRKSELALAAVNAG